MRTWPKMVSLDMVATETILSVGDEVIITGTVNGIDFEGANYIKLGTWAGEMDQAKVPARTFRTWKGVLNEKRGLA
jgi:hypothetical protein